MKLTLFASVSSPVGVPVDIDPRALQVPQGPKDTLPGWCAGYGTHRRRNAWEHVSAIVLDLDAIYEPDSLRVFLRECGYDMFVHLTPSSTQARPRARVIIPSELPVDNVAGAVEWWRARIGDWCAIDSASENPCQYWYRPTSVVSHIVGKPWEFQLSVFVERKAPQPSISVSSTMLELALKRGPVSRKNGGYIVVCPWEDEHSCRNDGTMIFDPTSHNNLGGFRCLHNVCRGRTNLDVLRYHDGRQA